MITPLQSAAFSMQADPGVFALMIGSGVSRPAGPPTGGEETVDLVRKLTSLEGDDPVADAETWFAAKYGKAPNHSELPDGLAKTRSERQQLLRSHWEPAVEEKDVGLKQPAAAHRAIAWLVARGYVKAIVPTNFDRPLEASLAEAGVVPTVISTPKRGVRASSR